MGAEDAKQLPWPALILAITAVSGGIFGLQSQLTSSRPAAPKSFDSPPTGLEQMEARLWEDPLRAVFEQKTEGKPELKPTSSDLLAKAIAEDIVDGHEVLIMPAIISGAPYAEDQERRRRSRYALLSGLHVAGYTPIDGDRLGAIQLSAHFPIPFERFENNPRDAKEEGKEEGHPEHPLPDRIYVFWIVDPLLGIRSDLVLDRLYEELKIVVESENQGSQKAGEEATTVGRAPPGRTFKDKVSLAMIGPANSATLSRMLSDAVLSDRKGRIESEHHSPVLLSPWATSSDAGLVKQAGLRVQDEFKEFSEALKEFKKQHDPSANPWKERHTAYGPSTTTTVPEREFAFFRHEAEHKELHKTELELFFLFHLGFDFHRTVHADDVLMSELVHELGRRGVDLKDPADHVVLVSEWDTSYGRTLPESFISAANGGSPDNIRRFVYERGLDGIVQGAEGEKISGSEKEKKSSDEKVDWFDRSHQEKASGKSQFDYMRRMADQISELNARLQRGNEGRVRAIGILGSDVYDKLVVLRALRKRFPGVVFFTTDLDAILFQRDEIEWTRNLLVLSSYGLKLHEELQRDTPPFRNSYQTAIFASVLLALDQIEHKEFMPMQKPRIFEIGKAGGYDLSQLREGGRSKFYPDRTDRWDVTRYRFVLMGMVLSAGVLFLLLRQIGKEYQGKLMVAPGTPPLAGPFTIYGAWWQQQFHKLFRFPSNKSGIHFRTDNLSYIGKVANYLPLSGVLLFMVFGLTVGFAYDRGLGEPWSLFDGISIWPSQIIRIVVFFLSFHFVFLSGLKLERNLLELSQSYGLTGFKEANPTSRVRTGERRWLARRRRWMLSILLATLALVVGIPMIEGQGFGSLPKFFLQTSSVAVGSLALYFALSSVVGQSKFERLRERKFQAGSGMTHSAEKIWHRHLSANSYRTGIRVVAYSSIAYVCFGILLSQQFGFPLRPIRGVFSSIADWSLLLLSLTGMVFLIIYVIWVSRRCVGLIKDLSRRDTRWPQAAYDDFFAGQPIDNHLKRGGRCDPLSDWFDVQFIARRTEVVGYMILYPFIIAFLQILSRNHFIDNWHWSNGTIALFTVTLSIALFFALKLRATAERARKKAVKNLDEKRAHALALAASENPPARIREMVGLIEMIRNQVSKIEQGAFTPISRHPVLMAVLIPFGGYGSLAFLDLLVS
ncbi:hypothetical protein V2O64_11660 [Verrucomicrobiaceae bacterium 227]